MRNSQPSTAQGLCSPVPGSAQPSSNTCATSPSQVPSPRPAQQPTKCRLAGGVSIHVWVCFSVRTWIVRIPVCIDRTYTPPCVSLALSLCGSVQVWLGGHVSTCHVCAYISACLAVSGWGCIQACASLCMPLPMSVWVAPRQPGSMCTSVWSSDTHLGSPPPTLSLAPSPASHYFSSYRGLILAAAASGSRFPIRNGSKCQMIHGYYSLLPVAKAAGVPACLHSARHTRSPLNQFFILVVKQPKETAN